MCACSAQGGIKNSYDLSTGK